MSDTMFPTGPTGEFPTDPTSGGGSSYSGELEVQVHCDYHLRFIELSDYLLGDTFPLKWSILRQDGQLVAVPVSAEVVIRDDTGTILINPITTNPYWVPDLESNQPQLLIILAALWEPLETGIYSVELTAVWASPDAQERSCLTYINVI